jgi:hypothetical protein
VIVDTGALNPPGNSDDADWRRVRRALDDPKWDFRTIDGISRDAGLAKERVRDLIERHRDEVRLSRLRDANGRDLYTLASKPETFEEVVATVQVLVSGKT